MTGTALLALMLAGCVKHEVSEVGSAPSNIIGFEITTTRADVTDVDAMKADPAGFKVYGTSGNNPDDWYTGIDGHYNHLFAHGKWGWESGNDAFWPADALGYPMKFYAWYPAAPEGLTVTAESVSAGLTFDFTVEEAAEDQVDLVAGTVTTGSRPLWGNLPMAFDHILSRVNFTVTAAPGYTVYVPSLGIKNLSGTGSYDMISGSWSNNTTFNQSYHHYRDMEGGKPFTGGTAQPFYETNRDRLILMPQSTVTNAWDPFATTAVADLAVGAKTHIEILYRLEEHGGDLNYVGFASATSHPSYNAGSGYTGPLFVKVAYPYAALWTKGNGYICNIELHGSSGGYLIDQNYYDQYGNPTTLAVAEPTIPNPVLWHKVVKNLPRWRGFNFPKYASASEEWFFSQFEKECQWMVAWGFNFVRLPLSYRNYIQYSGSGIPTATQTTEFDETKVAAIERLVRIAIKYNLHVNLCLHRAPGYSVTDGSASEPFNLWSSSAAQSAFNTHWDMWAKRFKDLSPELLSFNLVNEPNITYSLIPPILDPIGTYRTICTNAMHVIHQQTPTRIVIADGRDGARLVTSSMPGLAQSVHGYDPSGLTHYDGNGTAPTWPGTYSGVLWNKARLQNNYFQDWITLANQGVPVHCGEIGCNRYAPHAVTLAFLEDLLDILKQNNIGWALWELRGWFGVIESERSDVVYETFNGYPLDRELLELLQKY